MPYKQLTEGKRYQIEALLCEGFSQKEISKAIGCSASTISREIKRNSDRKGYRGTLAIKRTDKRRRTAKKRTQLDKPMCSLIDELLKQYLSPEQISGRLKLELGLKISHETIYKHIWEDKEKGGKLYNYLRNKGKRYRARGNKKDSRGSIKNAISIDQRPKEVEEKNRIGDWEIDTVIGKNHKQALVTIVDRKSKLTLMKKVTDRTEKSVTAATIELLKPYKEHVQTITADNGKEFAGHQKVINKTSQSSVAKELECDYYFAHPYSSWERGVNDHRLKAGGLWLRL